MMTKKKRSIEGNDDGGNNSETSSSRAKRQQRLRRSSRLKKKKNLLLSTMMEGPLLACVLEFLHWKDLNEFACVSKISRIIRNDTLTYPLLDQTREGCIDFSNARTGPDEYSDSDSDDDDDDGDDFSNARTSRNYKTITPEAFHFTIQKCAAFLNNNAHHNNYKHIMIRTIPIRKFSFDDYFPYRRYFEKIDPLIPDPYPVFEGIQSIRFAGHENGYRDDRMLRFFISLLPNLQVIDLEGFEISPYVEGGWSSERELGCEVFEKLNECCPHLHTIRYTDAKVPGSCCISFSGYYIKDFFPSFRELYIDGSSLVIQDVDEEFNEYDTFLLYIRDRVEKVSCYGTLNSHFCKEGVDGAATGCEPISQEELMEFVRNAPKLRWFRSDLTTSNIRILQLEIPGRITFITD